MRQVGLVVGAPVGVLGQEAVLVADDLAFEVRCECWMIVCEAWESEEAWLAGPTVSKKCIEQTYPEYVNSRTGTTPVDPRT